MSSATTYAESVASCRAPTPLGSPPQAAAAAAVPDALRLPVKRQLDFPGDGDNLDDDDDDFLFRAAEEMERSLYEPTRRAAMGRTPPPPVAPPAFPERQCICGRGPCDVVQKEPGRWLYVCSATPKCNDSAWCEEPGLHPNSRPAFWIHPQPNNPHAFNTPSNHKAGATTQVNVNLQGLRPNSQPAFWSHPEPNNPRAFNTPSNHKAGVTTQVNVNQQGAHATIPVNVSPQGAGATTPVNISPQDADATTPVNFRPEGARSNGAWPICMCTAGKCKILKLKGVDYYVCHIQKGQGACAHRELVNATAEEPPPARYNNPRESGYFEYNPVMKEANGHNFVMMGDHNETRPFNPDQPPEYDEWPFDIVEGDVVPTDFLAPHPTSTAVVTRGSPIMLHQPVAMVELETPTKSPLPPKCAINPTTPRSGGCFRCHEEGHWAINCPKKDACFHCGLIGHWKNDCPRLHDKIGC